MGLRDTILRQLKNSCEDFGLEQAFYTDPDYFKLDMKTIWYRDWLFVGHDYEVPKSSHYSPCRSEPNAVVIVCSRDGQILAFYNSCRHRSSHVCTTHKGQSVRLVCPYHQWTYDLDGEAFVRPPYGQGI